MYTTVVVSAMLSRGDPAPAFELPDHNGETVQLSAFEGERIVLYFYPKAGTEGCTIEANGFSDSFEAFDRHDVEILGVSTDSVAEIAAFEDEQELPFVLLSDEDGSVARRYESMSDGDSALRNTYVIGPDGSIEAVYENVSPGTHADEVLDDIESLETT